MTRNLPPRLTLALPLSLLVALAACGERDPSSRENGAASAGAINASVAEAQSTAVDARMNAAGAPDTPEEREKIAKNVLGESNTAASTGGSAAARQGRPTTVDPGAGDPLPPQPREGGGPRLRVRPSQSSRADPPFVPSRREPALSLRKVTLRSH